MALGVAGRHVSEHGHGAWLEGPSEVVAPCSDGLQNLHVDAPRLVDYRSCPACLFAHIAVADDGRPAPTLAHPVAARRLNVASVPAPFRSAGHPRAPRGPPSLPSGS